jgi:hypothetical protein
MFILTSIVVPQKIFQLEPELEQIYAASQHCSKYHVKSCTGNSSVLRAKLSKK